MVGHVTSVCVMRLVLISWGLCSGAVTGALTRNGNAVKESSELRHSSASRGSSELSLRLYSAVVMTEEVAASREEVYAYSSSSVSMLHAFLTCTEIQVLNGLA
jgi:hypothetical protein